MSTRFFLNISCFLFGSLCCFFLYGNILYAKPSSHQGIKINGLEPNFVNQILKNGIFQDRTIPNGSRISSNETETKLKELIKETLEPNGYFNASITCHLTPPQMICDVKKGPEIHYQEVIFRLKNEKQYDPVFASILKNFPIKKGEVFNGKKYEQVKQSLMDLAENEGFLNAKLTEHRLYLDPNLNTATLHWEFDTGPRFHFGPVHYEPNPFSESFLSRFQPFQTHDFYSSEKLLKFQEGLSGTSYFQQVRVDPLPPSANSTLVPIDVRLVPRHQQFYSLGVGYGTDTGPRASIGTDYRYVNAYGHSMKAVVSIATIQKTFLARYTIPGPNPLMDQYNVIFAIQHLNVPTGKSLKKQLGVDFTTKKNDWQRTIALNAQVENYERNDMPYQFSRFIMPSMTWTKTKGNKPYFPTEGYRISLTVQGAVEEMLSSTTFGQIKISEKYIRYLTPDLRGIFRGEMGYTQVRNADHLPLSLLFLEGGAQSIRGFAYKSIGPGIRMVTGSVELQQRVYRDFYGAIFYDAGDAFFDFPIRLKRSAGVGVVWLSLFGTMELTYARDLTLHKPSGRIQFSMGSDL